MSVRVRRLSRDESLLAAALHTQALRAAGTPPAPGFLDEYARAWLASGDSVAQWVAEVGGQHAGTITLSLPPMLPGVSAKRPNAEVLAIFAHENSPAVLLGMLRQVTADVRDLGYAGCQWPNVLKLPQEVLDASGALAHQPTLFRVN
ncbi:hypothetical protein K0651_09800 [Ornithinimicrobium sp. Arc0846-15]|nr:hypothetical protein [Ornithinimicrobium laminariae]